MLSTACVLFWHWAASYWKQCKTAGSCFHQKCFPPEVTVVYPRGVKCLWVGKKQAETVSSAREAHSWRDLSWEPQGRASAFTVDFGWTIASLQFDSVTLVCSFNQPTSVISDVKAWLHLCYLHSASIWYLHTCSFSFVHYMLHKLTHWKPNRTIHNSECLSHCVIVVERQHAGDNSCKRKDLSRGGLQFQRASPLSSWQLHGSGVVAESYIVICRQ